MTLPTTISDNHTSEGPVINSESGVQNGGSLNFSIANLENTRSLPVETTNPETSSVSDVILGAANHQTEFDSSAPAKKYSTNMLGGITFASDISKVEESILEETLTRRRRSLQALSAMRELKNAIISPTKFMNDSLEVVVNRHHEFCARILGELASIINPNEVKEITECSSSLLRTLFGKIGKPFTLENEKSWSLAALFISDHLILESKRICVYQLCAHQNWFSILQEMDNFTQMNMLEKCKNDLLIEIVSEWKKKDSFFRNLYHRFHALFGEFFQVAPGTLWSLKVPSEPAYLIKDDVSRYSNELFLTAWTLLLVLLDHFNVEGVQAKEQKEILSLHVVAFVISFVYENIPNEFRKDLDSTGTAAPISGFLDLCKYALMKLNLDAVMEDVIKTWMSQLIGFLQQNSVLPPDVEIPAIESNLRQLFSPELEFSGKLPEFFNWLNSFYNHERSKNPLSIDGRSFLQLDTNAIKSSLESNVTPRMTRNGPLNPFVTPTKSRFSSFSPSSAVKRNLMNSSFSHVPATPMTLRHFRLSDGALSIQDIKNSQSRLFSIAQSYENSLKPSDNMISVTLKRFFDKSTGLSINPLDLISQRIKALETSNESQLCSLVPYSNLILSLQLHWLENMLLSERDRLNGQEDFSKWLNDTDFHGCLLCCITEIVRFSFVQEESESDEKVNLDSFMLLVEFFKVKLFDLSVVIETVIKSEPNLTWMIVRRLKEIEEKILESKVWAEADPLYKLLEQESTTTISASDPIDNRKRSATSEDEDDQYINEVQSEKVPFSPRKALKVIANSEPDLYGRVSNISLKSESVNMDREAIANVSSTSSKLTRLELFFRKFFRLLHLRLYSFSRKLNLSEAVVKNVWSCMVYALEREHVFKLLHYGRHMDQLLICSIYGICKIMDDERKFKEIINVYREQPQCIDATYRKVCIGSDEMHLMKKRPTSDEARKLPYSVDVIEFYNQIFLPKMKAVIYGFQRKSSAASESKGRSVIHVDSCPLPVLPDFSSPRRVSSSHSIFVSPWKSNPSSDQHRHHHQFMTPGGKKATQILGSGDLMTPMTKRLYSFTEDSSSAIKSSMTPVQTLIGDSNNNNARKKISRRLDFSNTSSF